jgi:uncharacterized protein (TIGR02145 family)
MKNTIYLLASVILLLSCKKESSNPSSNKSTNSTTNTTTSTAKYGNGVTDLDGYKYKTVVIGNQEWMGENLKVSKYNDGTVIPNIIDNTQWSKLTTGAWCYNNNNNISNDLKFAKLYNWYALSPTTNGNKNVCPTGWHVPTDNDWSIMTDFLGGEAVAGGKLRDVGESSWNSSSSSNTNPYLFTALPGGQRDSDGNFTSIGNYGSWWSNTESTQYYFNISSWARSMEGSGSNISRLGTVKGYGLSIRCIKD